MKVYIRVLNTELYTNYSLPKKATEGSAAVDLISAHNYYIAPYESHSVQTGIAVWIKDVSFAGIVLPRSSLSKINLMLDNTTGLIDSDYQGELIIKVWNRSKEHGVAVIEKGDRIAQLLIVPIVSFDFEEVNEFDDETDRGVGGFGSTGKC